VGRLRRRFLYGLGIRKIEIAFASIFNSFSIVAISSPTILERVPVVVKYHPLPDAVIGFLFMLWGLLCDTSKLLLTRGGGL